MPAGSGRTEVADRGRRAPGRPRRLRQEPRARAGRAVSDRSWVAGPNASWSARLAFSSSIADRTGAEATSPLTTICAGSTPTPGKSRFSASKPCLEGKRSGSVVSPEKPVLMASTGAAQRSRSAVAETRLTSGRFITPPTSADQKRPSEPALLIARRPITGMRPALTRSPSRLSTAGSSVNAATTETMPTRIAPSARLRRIVSGTRSIPHIASTKAMPLNRTARLAVAPEATMASIFSCPRTRSSR